MSRRKANLEHEYALEREIKELKEQIAKLKKLLREQEKSASIGKGELSLKPTKKAPAKKLEKECPGCGAEVKEAPTPVGTLELCSAVCGWRNMRKK